MVYCIIPQELGARLEPAMSRYGVEQDVEILFEHRCADRRTGDERRGEPWPHDLHTPLVLERRRIRNQRGRRIAEQRCTTIPVSAPAPLPRRARINEDRLVFVERLENAAEHRDDVDTARLISRIQGGEQQLFAHLYERYVNRFHLYLKLVCGDPALVEAGIERAFLRAHEELTTQELGLESPRVWLFGAVAAVAGEQARPRYRAVPGTTPAATPAAPAGSAGNTSAVWTQALRWLSDQELLTLIACLPVEDREVVVLRYLMGLSATQVAVVLTRSADRVRASERAGLGLLRARLDSLASSPESSPMRVPMRRCRPLAPVTRARRLALTY